jgi:hypothetical protein
VCCTAAGSQCSLLPAVGAWALGLQQLTPFLVLILLLLCLLVLSLLQSVPYNCKPATWLLLALPCKLHGST